MDRLSRQFFFINSEFFLSVSLSVILLIQGLSLIMSINWSDCMHINLPLSHEAQSILNCSPLFVRERYPATPPVTSTSCAVVESPFGGHTSLCVFPFGAYRASVITLDTIRVYLSLHSLSLSLISRPPFSLSHLPSPLLSLSLPALRYNCSPCNLVL